MTNDGSFSFHQLEWFRLFLVYQYTIWIQLQLLLYLNTPLPLLDSERFGVKDIKGSSHSFSFQFFRARADITQTSTKPTKQDGCYAPKNEYRIGAAGHRRSWREFAWALCMPADAASGSRRAGFSILYSGIHRAVPENFTFYLAHTVGLGHIQSS